MVSSWKSVDVQGRSSAAYRRGSPERGRPREGAAPSEFRPGSNANVEPGTLGGRAQARSGRKQMTTSTPDGAWQAPSWEEIVREHSVRVYRLAYRLTGNQHDAEDLTQEVFVRVFRSLSTYTPGTFEGWLHRITTNLFLDQMRRRQRIRIEPWGDATEQLAGPDGTSTPERGFEHA